MTIDNDSGEFIPPKSTYLDDVEVYDAELGGIVPAWKALIYHGAKAKHLAQTRADSAAVMAGEARKGKPSSEPKRAPPPVADAVEATQMEQIQQAIADLEARLDAFEQRKAEETARRERCDAALALAEKIAEEAPATMLDALPPAPKERLH